MKNLSHFSYLKGTLCFLLYFFKFKPFVSRVSPSLSTGRKVDRNNLQPFAMLQHELMNTSKRVFSSCFRISNPANIYLFKIINKNIWKRYHICSDLMIDTRAALLTSFWCLYCVFIVSFYRISHIFLVHLMPTLSRYLFTGKVAWRNFAIVFLLLLILLCQPNGLSTE